MEAQIHPKSDRIVSLASGQIVVRADLKAASKAVLVHPKNVASLEAAQTALKVSQRAELAP
ncbi:MAG: hypothetical protein AAGM27_10060 [Cyanobacteria bacterium J06554_3]